MQGAMDAETITIHEVVGEEQTGRVLGYIQPIYQKNYGTSPETIWQNCLIAENGDGIVGVMAMGFSKRGKEAQEVLDHFLFGSETLVHPLESFVALGRWVAARREAGRALMFAAVKLALARGRTHSISCSKPNVCEYVREHYHLRFQSHNLLINRSTIAPADRPYFLTDPPPQLCIGELKQWHAELEQQIPPMFEIEV